ncbi:MAG: pseudouridine-5'-phosphate glycosidase [Azospirillaceae bacterium]
MTTDTSMPGARAPVPDLLDVAPEVAVALAAGRPVVALESTILSHGMPWPRNLETARSVESRIRAEGAVPATIAVLGGRILVGVDEAGLEHLARADGIAKVSRRDLGAVIAAGGDGATTVAGTMLCAHMAGIEVFVTGGLGGVHRRAEETFDISADLEELARTPVTVVSAGAKAILDLPKTLEVLETRGVPVVGWATDSFPAFYCRTSGLPVAHRIEGAEDGAALIRAHRAIGGAGIVVAHPIPEAAALPEDEVEAAIGRALEEAAAAGIAGREVTPYLLDRLVEITGGRSLDANVALVEANATAGARLAGALARQTAGAPLAAPATT